jgi:hypothetical protein
MGLVAQPVFKTGAAWQPHARSVRLRRRSVLTSLQGKDPLVDGDPDPALHRSRAHAHAPRARPDRGTSPEVDLEARAAPRGKPHRLYHSLRSGVRFRPFRCMSPHAVTTVLTKSPQFPRPAREVFRCSRARPRRAVVSIEAARSRSLTPAPNRALRPLSSLSRRPLPEDFAISLEPRADGAAPRNRRVP